MVLWRPEPWPGDRDRVVVVYIVTATIAWQIDASLRQKLTPGRSPFRSALQSLSPAAVAS